MCSGNLPIDPILCKWSLTCKNVPNFDDSAKCFDTILNEKYDYMNPSKNCKYINYCRILHKNYFDILSLLSCVNAIYIDHYIDHID